MRNKRKGMVNEVVNHGAISGKNINLGIQTTTSRQNSKNYKQIDEEECVEVDKIKKIKIDSDLANVTIAVGNSQEANIHLYGKVCAKGKLVFEIIKSKDVLNISANFQSSSVTGDLNLDVLIPQKVFDLISTKCQDGDVELNDDIEAEHIIIELQNGDIFSNATFEKIDAKSQNGDIGIAICAKSDIEVCASSTNGDVKVRLKNIGTCNLSTSSFNGSIKNKSNSTGIYEATGRISSMNGDVSIR